MVEQQSHRTVDLRQQVPDPPPGWSRLRWWGPGLLWAMSAVGSGSVLFTPRVGSEYGYTFLWLLLGVAFLMWVMIREAGRFAVVTGRTLLDGYSRLPGPKNWALWLVFVPQLVAAVAGVAGLTALIGSVLQEALPGSLVLWSLITLAITSGVVVSGGYRTVSRVALVLALALVAIMVVAAGRVYQPDGDAVSGLLPTVPANIEIPFILPWVGTILAGSMGIIWFSYWTATRGYGGGTADTAAREQNEQPGSADASDEERATKLNAWFGTLSNTAGLGVVTGTIIITAFLVLGAELLAPAGIVPSGTDVASDLTRLLAEVWGTFGHWLMVVAILVTLGGSVLANQDGWSRSFADIVLLLSRPSRAPGQESGPGRGRLPRSIDWLISWRPSAIGQRRALKILFVIVVTGIVPAIVVVLVRNPVAIMSVSGIVAALHTPFIVFATLAVNRRLPAAVRPGRVFTLLLGCAGLFYTVFASLYVANLVGLIGP